ncbi:ABC transporter ATP-binding protein [Helicobacter sp. T3_23-1059]
MKTTNQNKKPKKGVPRLLEISGEKKTLLAFSSLLSALSAILQFVPYFAGYWIVQEFVLNAHDLANVDKNLVFYCALIAISSVIVSMLLQGATFTLSHFAAYRILYNLRLRLARHLATLPLGYFTHTTKGAIHKTLQENVEKIENFVAHKIPEFIQSVVGACAIFVIFVWSDWRLAIVCVAVYLVGLFVQFSVYGKTKVEMKACLEQFFSKLESINSSSMEFIKGISVVKMFGKSIFAFQDFAKSVEDYHHFTLSFTYKCMRPFGVFTTLVNGFILFALPFCAYFITRDTFNLYDILVCVFFILLSNGLIAPFLRLFNLSSELMQINEAVERVDTIFRQKPLAQSKNPLKPTRFDIEFKSVDFAYQNPNGELSAKHALKNVSFALRQGESLAIVGKSGAGKSSIVHLLARFYERESGGIFIGGVDIKDIAECDLMEAMSFVFQENFMFFDSLRENIKAGKEASDDEILHAAHLAQCDEIITKYGLDCVIGQGGMNLSGGEAQRINLARAILKNAPILLLDEVNSALDSENEAKLNEALKNLARGKTLIMVAHKLNSALKCDKVALMEKGEILALGTHKDLLKSCPQYKELWNLYNDTQQWSIKN